MKITSEDHDWTQPLINGPQDVGFDYSFITSSGIQNQPYSFFRDGFLTTNVSDAVWWTGIRNHTMRHLASHQGEGDPEWDSSKYNQILVNRTEAFCDDYLGTN